MKNYFLLIFIFLLALKQSCTCQVPKDTVRVDGSSTVYMLSEAVAEEYQKHHKSRVSMSSSGTGSGFKKLCRGNVRLIGASRAISESEQELCKKNGILASEFAVGLDGIVVAVNKKNTWLHEIDIKTLKKLFEPEAEGKINFWSDLDASWPRRRISIFAPGISSGTYDYFTKVIVGTEHASRGDITSSEDDNVLVHGVRTNIDGIGFFSFAYYQENRDEIKALFIINEENDRVFPTEETIKNGRYKPLSRPIFFYANLAHAHEAEKAFLRFYLENSSHLAHDVGFVALNEEILRESLGKIGRK